MRFTRRAMRVAVLGCGPAGLFAATALEQNGHSVEIYSRKRKSELFGTQYLHAPIPELTDDQEPIEVSYRLQGTVDDYREKVYGLRDQPILTSVQALDTKHLAWDIRRAYDIAWSRWESRIVNYQNIGPEALADLNSHVQKVVSSIPAIGLCVELDHHRFETQQIWAAGDAPERGMFCPVDVAEEGEILCDGNRDVGWYRQSRVFGYRSVEWAYRAERRPPIEGLNLITKPISTTCDCFSRTILKVGRYGRWTKGILSHTAYTEAAAL